MNKSVAGNSDVLDSEAGEIASISELTADQVIQYLKEHPNFFSSQDELLLELKIPHQRGDTISLVERQMSLLRDHNLELRRRLGKLVSVARDNDRLFDQIRQLVLALLESQDIEQAIETLKDSLEQDFEVEFHSLILFTDNVSPLPIRSENPEAADKVLGDLIAGFKEKSPLGQKVICGCMKSEELEFLFPDHHESVGSVALAPLDFPETVGILVLGSRDENHFRASAGSLFLAYLSEVTSRVFSRLM